MSPHPLDGGPMLTPPTDPGRPAGQAPRPGPAAPARKRLTWFRLTRTWVSSSPTLIVYLALLALPFIEIDRRAYVLLPVSAVGIGLGVNAGLHRFFSHRSYKTSRAVQFLIGCCACVALQKGPLWWAAKHRAHHRHSDDELDPHSPVAGGFWHAHMGWLFGRDQLALDHALVKDLAKYPELVWLERLWMVPGLLYGTGCYLALGWGGVVIGYGLAVATTYQVTFLVNSVGHLFGPQRFQTGDQSRNNLMLGFLAMGDGWHNNHHRVPYSARHGFAWYELDFCYSVIWLLSKMRLVWDVKLPPAELMAGHDSRAVPQTALDDAAEVRATAAGAPPAA